MILKKNKQVGKTELQLNQMKKKPLDKRIYQKTQFKTKITKETTLKKFKMTTSRRFMRKTNKTTFKPTNGIHEENQNDNFDGKQPGRTPTGQT